ncbi:MAG: TlpA family protein disulfide reductase [Ignavibacteriales bacterium]|nr:TlpA family protein disulfide reductase [Ignavibacteriales bacterium]
MKSSFLFFSILCPVLLAGCQPSLPEEDVWSGVITLAEERPLPFRMYLDLQGASPSGFFLVSDERTEIPEIRRSGDSLSIIISEYAAAMHGRWDGKRWIGQFFRYRHDTVALDFSAAPESGLPSLAPGPQPHSGVQLVGSFQVYYARRGGIDSSLTAKFWTRGDSVFGTFIDPSGDHGLMAGVQTGTQARLGRFIGWQANLVEMEYKDGGWKGKYYARQYPPDPFTLVSRPSRPAESSGALRTRLRNPVKAFWFEGITVGGDTVRSTDARFRRKALVVDIMGTWCHNCLDEAPVLRQLYSEFKDQGLEIVGLSFEITNDPVVGRMNLGIYKKRHAIDFPLLYAGSLDAENVDVKLRSQLDDFFAYPTSIFVDRRGKIREIHWGFKGPGTGEEYQREIERFYSYIREILK